MNIWEFFHEHYILAFFALCFAYGILKGVLVILPNRILRHWNIRKHGSPPDHCVADGDLPTQQKDKNDD